MRTMRLRFLIGAAIAAVCLMFIPSTVSAHHPVVVSSDYTCLPDGTWEITWTASPDAVRGFTWWLTAPVNTSATPVPDSQPIQFVTTEPGSATGATVTVTGVWSNRASGTRTGSVSFGESTCTETTTTTSSSTTTSTTSTTTTSTTVPETTTTVTVPEQTTTSSTTVPETTTTSSSSTTTSTTSSTTVPDITTTVPPSSTPTTTPGPGCTGPHCLPETGSDGAATIVFFGLIAMVLGALAITIARAADDYETEAS